MALFTTTEISIPCFWDFVPTEESEWEFAREVFALYEKARDAVLDSFEKNGVVFFDNLLNGSDAWEAACSIFLYDLMDVWGAGFSTILGEYVGEEKYAHEEELEWLRVRDMPDSIAEDYDFCVY